MKQLYQLEKLYLNPIIFRAPLIFARKYEFGQCAKINEAKINRAKIGGARKKWIKVIQLPDAKKIIFLGGN